ncbi:hypothetical protein MCOR27_004302 [Pyricularia oryzae]|uniref:Uncharacterized protein n=2 Tax=Pyricularia TaxID=48558 RepID=A0ABQ8P0H3_PYRGI|nr:hypothetical protein MCOR01_000199 [Pyricularia oryzae]KAI6304788.1 hypothetical protein MCOR33_000300 [Pyricularia grisea]KAH9428087.1 hypothetical protein MCOR02_011580 [Pyricularia oryzae]KAI6263441.1 hypothetical protein MCOR19_000343 [Pyricularia oryzae]KAI6281274.1 hypothetical protein MCOR27_004302 [Pyricularia oryzae]
MQFSTILVALFASVALAAPAVDSSSLEARQAVRTECVFCRQDCFNSKGTGFNSCIESSCNKALGCGLTP